MVRLFRKRESDPAARPRANWKAGSGQIDALIHSVEPRQVIRTGIAASAIAHLSVLMLVLLFADVRPLGSLTDEPVAVEIVTPEEVAESKREEPPLAAQPEPADVADTSAKPAAPIPPPPAAPEPVAQPKKEAPPSPPRPAAETAVAQPQPKPQPQSSPSPSYAPPQPDLSVKYHVLLGLPPPLPLDARGSGDKPGDPFDGPASQSADIAPTLVTEFRRHLKTCSRLPPSIAPSDRLKIKLRVSMTPEGKLAGEPVLIEASASAKGPALMQGAIGALQACQPYAMLPVDRYGEWKVLDLSFTPQDFSGG
jgi:outer membrane biosynthesis protein TonB